MGQIADNTGANPLAEGDDVTEKFQQRSEQQMANEASDRLTAEYGIYPDAPEGTPTATGDTKPAPIDLMAATPQEGQLTLSSTGKFVGDVVKDAARGATEIPRAVVGGVRDAAQETINLVGELQAWMGENSGGFLGGRLAVDKDGKPVSLSRKDFEKQQKGLGQTTSPQLPAIDRPTTTTGNIVHGVSQFLTGFLGPGKFVKGAGVVASTAKGAVAMFTSFDGHEKRLSNLIQDVPVLKNPVTEFLAANPNDSKLEGRLKNTLENAGLGILADGLISGLKAVRSARIAKQVENNVHIKAGEVPPHTPPPTDPELVDDFFGGSETDGFLNEAKPTLAEQKIAASTAEVDSVASGKSQSGKTKINFGRINSSDDVKKLIQKTADAFTESIDTAKRGTQTFDQIAASASEENALKLIMERRVGEVFNASQLQAVRSVFILSSQKLKESITLSATNPSEANLFIMRQMMIKHNLIQKEVLGATTETARALSSMRMTASADWRQAKNLGSMLSEMGGAELNMDLAVKLQGFIDAGLDHSVQKFVEHGAFARTQDAVSQIWINGLLSNPSSHVANFTSNMGSIGNFLYERKSAEYVSQALGTQGGVVVGEAVQASHAILEAFRDGLRAAGKTIKTGSGGTAFGKMAEIPHPGSLKAKTWGVPSDSFLGKSLDVIDVTTQAPGRLMGASDEFFKTIFYRMELHATALRMATREAKLGNLPEGELQKRMLEIIDNPPESVKISAMNTATYHTFNSKPEAALNTLGKAIQKLPIIGRLILPFKNTPINILTFAAERSPLAPLITNWRADYFAGGARKDLALARMATGTMILMHSIDMAMKGHTTGSGPAHLGQRQMWKRDGHQEYSVKVGDTYVQYNRLDPVGMTVGIGADIADAIINAQGDISNDEFEKVMVQAAFAISSNVMSKTYMRGTTDFIGALDAPKQKAQKYFQSVAASTIPAGVGAIRRNGIPGVSEGDPYLRVVGDSIDALKNKIPGLSKDLPLYRDLWGRPVDSRSSKHWAYNMFSPVHLVDAHGEPIDKELSKLEYYPEMPDKKVNLNGISIELNPKQYSRFMQLMGNETLLPQFGMGMKDFMNEMVTGGGSLSPAYNMRGPGPGPDGGKAQYIQYWMNQYKKAAITELIAEDAALNVDYNLKKDKYRGKLDPALFGE